MLYTIEITKFPERSRFKIEVNLNEEKTSYIRLMKSNSSVLFKDSNIENGIFFKKYSIDKLPVQFILTPYGENYLNNFSQQICIGDRFYIKINNFTGVVLFLKKE